MKRLVAIAALMWFTAVQATTVSHLYQAGMGVNSTRAVERQKMIRQGLSEVLIKISGNPSVNSLPMVVNALDESQNFLAGYSYQHVSEAANDAQPSTPYRLTLTFSQPKIKQLLRAAKQGIWGKERPLVMAWVTVQDAKQKQAEIVGQDSVITTGLKEAGSRRGLPIIFPMLDLTESASVAPDDINANHLPLLENLSGRYQADAILIGQLKQNVNGEWEGSWTLSFQGEQMSWQHVATEPRMLLDRGVDDVANSLATRFAYLDKAPTQQHTILRVANVNSVNDFARVLSYLQSLSPVKQVSIVKIEPDAIIYQLNLVSDANAFMRSVSLKPQILPDGPGMQRSNELHYRLVS